MGISPAKYEIITFLGRDPVRCKITVGNKCLPKVKNFKYLTCEISYENEDDVYIKKKNLLKSSSNTGNSKQHF